MPPLPCCPLPNTQRYTHTVTHLHRGSGELTRSPCCAAQPPPPHTQSHAHAHTHTHTHTLRIHTWLTYPSSVGGKLRGSDCCAASVAASTLSSREASRFAGTATPLPPVCVCVCERERERKSVCVCVCVHVASVPARAFQPHSEQSRFAGTGAALPPACACIAHVPACV